MATVVHAGSMTDDFATVASQLSKHILIPFGSLTIVFMVMDGRCLAQFGVTSTRSIYIMSSLTISLYWIVKFIYMHTNNSS
jgi:hypothetical protein